MITIKFLVSLYSSYFIKICTEFFKTIDIIKVIAYRGSKIGYRGNYLLSIININLTLS